MYFEKINCSVPANLLYPLFLAVSRGFGEEHKDLLAPYFEQDPAKEKLWRLQMHEEKEDSQKLQSPELFNFIKNLTPNQTQMYKPSKL